MALEVNMRPCGGFGPDMMDYANSTDVYKIWADMIAFDRSTKSEGAHASAPMSAEGMASSISSATKKSSRTMGMLSVCPVVCRMR